MSTICSTSDRYKAEWFTRKINQNKNIKTFLIDKILTRKESDFPWNTTELKDLNYEDLFEIAVAVTNKRIKVLCEKGRDWTYGADGKVSIVRNNGSKYTAGITGCKHKKYILALVYERQQDKFYLFAFPPRIKEHSIPFDLDGTPNTDNYMWDYRIADWEHFCNRAHTWMACK